MRILLAAVAVAVTTLALPTASPEASGLSSMHEQIKVGRKVCMKSHFHHGESGSGFASKAAAQAAAVRPWVNWTAFEYGRHWASFRIAAGKQWNCRSNKTERGVTWGCSVRARPCRH